MPFHCCLRKTSFFPWVLLVGLMILAGCAPGPVFGKRPEGLVVAVPNGLQAAAMRAAAEQYALAGGEPVTVETVGADTYASQVSSVLLAGLDRYDLVSLPAELLARWAGYRVLRPVAEGFDPAGLDPWLPALTVDGVLYGLPSEPDPVVLLFRADLLAAEGIDTPRDWEALRAAARALNAPPERFGLALAGSDMDSGMDFSAVLAGFGGFAVGPEYQVALGADPAQRALQFYTGLRFTDEVVSPDTADFTRSDVIAALAEGRAVFGIAPLSAASTLLDCPSGKDAKDTVICKDGKALLQWTWLPGLDENHLVGTLQAWAVPQHAAHPEEAARFAAWLVSNAGARVWAQSGGIPANTEALLDLEPEQVEDGSAAKGTAQAPTMSTAQAQAISQARGFWLAFPQAATIDLLWKAQNSMVHAALSGEKTPELALREAAEHMEKALKQGGYSPPAE